MTASGPVSTLRGSALTHLSHARCLHLHERGIWQRAGSKNEASQCSSAHTLRLSRRQAERLDEGLPQWWRVTLA